MPGIASVNGAIGASKLLAVVGDHLVAALHRADRRLEHGTAGVAEALARLQVRLLADHAVAAHFLHLAVGVGDDPVAGQQPGRHRRRGCGS